MTSSAKKILIVDDDTVLRETLTEQLHLHEEFSIDEAESAKTALEQLKMNNYDVILLDVGLPDMDGRDACRLIRRQGVKVPIIMLTAADSDADTILGLDAGANDYIVKPFRLGILLARLRAQLRQHENSEDAIFKIGPYDFLPSAKLLTHTQEGQKIRLTEKETGILRYLYRANGKIVSRDILLNEVWGYNSEVSTHTLETHIYRLRQKIETTPSKSSIIVTENGGYRLANEG